MISKLKQDRYHVQTSPILTRVIRPSHRRSFPLNDIQTDFYRASSMSGIRISNSRRDTTMRPLKVVLN